MIQPLDAFLTGLRTYLRARGINRKNIDEARIATALRDAEAIADGRLEDEPAALLFALSLHARALGAPAWEEYPLLCARNMARSQGFDLDARPDDVMLENLRLRVAFGQASFEDVRAWVLAHVRPIG